MINLRRYQLTAVNKTIDYLHFKRTGNPLIVAPTGSGKTHIIAGICQKLEKISPKNKVLIISHVEEILRQNVEKLREYIDRYKVGVYSSGMGKKQIRQFTVASIQTIANCPEKFQDYKYIIVDEAHRIPPSGMGQYQKFLSQLQQPRIIGLTATPYRLGHGMLTKKHLFDKIIYNIDVVDLIKDGYLSDLTTKEPSYELHTEDVKKVAGDFSKKDLGEKLDKDEITQRIVSELATHKNNRKYWIVFAIDIAHAEHISEGLNALGITCAALHSQMEKQERLDLIELFKAKYIQCLVSVEILTTGFDAPHVDLIALMRPTQSPVLHVQMIGRGMRISPGKENCLVLDFAGNTKRLGPINDVLLTQQKSSEEAKEKKESEPLTKTCPKCRELVGIAVKQCPICKELFPTSNKLSLTADSETEIIKTVTAPKKVKVTEFPVTKVKYTKHFKSGKPPSLKVTYICGLRVFNEWVALEHAGFARDRAVAWWKYRTGKECPETVNDALKNIGDVACPVRIMIDETQQYPQIIKHDFNFTRT